MQFLSRSAPVECGSKGECLRPRGRDQFPRAARTQCHTPGASAIAVYPLPDLGTTDPRSAGWLPSECCEGVCSRPLSWLVVASVSPAL